MRTWLGLLLVIGVATASAMQWWRTRLPDDAAIRTDDQEVAAYVDDADPGMLEPVEAEEVGESATGALAIPEADASDPAQVAGNDTSEALEREVPGGAVSESEAEARRKAGELVERAGKATDPIEQAKLLTLALCSDSLDRAADQKAYEALLEANRRGILNPRVHDLCMRTEVMKGDSLWAICRRLDKEQQIRTTPGLVRLVNGLTSDSIYAGARLKIVSAPLSLRVQKSRFRLEVMLGDILLKRYSVGHGKDNHTPEGEFTIATRLKDPVWYKPGAGEIPSDHPENILGTRWLGFAAKDGFPEAATFGIHGTRDDASIGTESSKGCVRMHNADVEELFEWVGEGVKILIVP